MPARLFVRGLKGPTWTPQLPHALAAPKNVNMFRTELIAISPEFLILEMSPACDIFDKCHQQNGT